MAAIVDCAFSLVPGMMDMWFASIRTSWNKLMIFVACFSFTAENREMVIATSVMLEN